MILVVGGIKGGTGKTTIATNLAVMRARKKKKILLVDADDQTSTLIWSNQRDAKGIPTTWTTSQYTGKAIYNQILRMKEDYDDVIIDAGGRDTTSLRASMALADIFLVPFKPRSFDVWTLSDIRVVISEMQSVNEKMKAYAMINQADPKGSDNNDAFDILNEHEEITCLPCRIGSRKAFANAAGDGLGVVELKNQDKKANEEIEELYKYIYKLYN